MDQRHYEGSRKSVDASGSSPYIVAFYGRPLSSSSSSSGRQPPEMMMMLRGGGIIPAWTRVVVRWRQPQRRGAAGAMKTRACTRWCAHRAAPSGLLEPWDVSTLAESHRRAGSRSHSAELHLRIHRSK